ncbi:MAG: TrkA family potassium uptake protein [Actinomycetota bacterium]|nr:TrkA family potassium uptake protein [Actinomycetota bacterium]
MHVVIVGSGRTGSELAVRLNSLGDDVALIDVDRRARKRLLPALQERFIEGTGMSRRVLEQAGIAHSEALVALTTDDFVNAVVARVGRDVYRVPRVFARRFDPAHTIIYRELGITAVSTVQATANQVAQLLHHERLEPRLSFGNGETLLVRSAIPAYLAGRPVSELSVPGEIEVAEVTRGGHSMIPEPSTLLAEHDEASFVVAAQSLGRLRNFLGGRWS